MYFTFCTFFSFKVSYYFILKLSVVPIHDFLKKLSEPSGLFLFSASDVVCYWIYAGSFLGVIKSEM